MRDASVLQHNIPLSSPRVPVLSLVDALRAQGFQGVGERIVHTATAGHVYDSRQLPAKRTYLQCVLALPQLLEAGVTSIPSGQPSAYYALVLKTRKQVPLNMGAIAYRKQLAETEGDFEALLALEAEAPEPPPPPIADRAPPARRASDDDADSIVGGDDEGWHHAARPAVAADGVPAGEPPPAALVAAPCDEGEAEGEGIVGGPGVHDGEHRRLPEKLLGQPLRRVSGRSDERWHYYDRITVTCNNPSHEKCQKSRSLELAQADMGPLAAVYFLGAWLKVSHMECNAHRRHKPTVADMRAFAAEYEP